MEENKLDQAGYEKARRLWDCRARDCNSPHSQLASETTKPPPVNGDAPGLDNGRSANQRSTKCHLPWQSRRSGSESLKSDGEHLLSAGSYDRRIESHGR